MADPDWNDFKIILALGRHGSVIGAARALCVDGSTVSRRLAALEDSLGAQLIVRGGQKFAWTAEGRSVLAAAETIETAVEGAALSVRAAKVDTAAPVVMSCPPGLSVILTRFLPEMKAKRPELSFELSGENRTVDLAKGEADIALRMYRPTEPGLVCRQVFELGWAVYAAENYFADHPRPCSYDELAKHRLVRYANSLHKVPGPRWLEEHRGTAASVQVDNTEAAANLVVAGGGIGVLPCPVAEMRGNMIRVFPEPIAAHTGWLVYHESVRDNARVRAALDVLAEVLEIHATLFSGKRE